MDGAFGCACQQGVAEGEQDVDGVGGRLAVAAGEVPGRVEQAAVTAEVGGGGGAFQSPQAVEIGFMGDGFDLGLDAFDGFINSGLEGSGAAVPLKKDALMAQFGFDKPFCHLKAEGKAAVALVLALAQGDVRGDFTGEAAAVDAVLAEEDDGDVGAEQGADGGGGKTDVAEEDELGDVSDRLR